MKKIQIAGILTAFFMTAFMFTGCSRREEAPPHQMAEALWELTMADDAEPLKELLGYASEEDVRKEFQGENYREKLASGLKEELAAMGLSMDEGEIAALMDSAGEMLSKVSFSAETVSAEEDRASVTVHVGYYTDEDTKAAMTEAAEEALEEYGQENLLDDAAYLEYMELYLGKYAKAMGELIPAEGTRDVQVEFERAETDINGESRMIWMPKDMNRFGADLMTAVMEGI